MIKGIYVAARGLDSRMKNLEIVANNLANINTTGFKREVPFSEVMNQAGQTRIQKVVDYSQGTLTQTSNPLNMAISGKGFFVVQTPNGNELTRNGNFQIDSNGFLTDEQGNRVLGRNGQINLLSYSLDKNQQVTVSNTGLLKVGDNIVDTLMIAQPVDPQDITRTGGTDFLSNAGIKPADENNFQVKQGYLEESNVNPIKEMEEMIQLNTEYGSASKMIDFLDQSLGEANQVGKV